MRWFMRTNFEVTAAERGLLVLDTIGTKFGFTGPMQGYLCEVDRSSDKGVIEIQGCRPPHQGGATLLYWTLVRAAYGNTWITMDQSTVISGDVVLTVQGDSVDKTHILVAIDAATKSEASERVYN